MQTDRSSLRDAFLLDPDLIYLNHGSFGACPRPVMQAYQDWQIRLERDPVAYLGREIRSHLAGARRALSEYLDCDRDDVVLFPNPTTAINVVARSLKLEPGDEILSTNHEYGAMDRTWRFVCERTGARYVQAQIPLPVSEVGSLLDRFWSRASDKTRAVFISHITSPTALQFPVETLCAQARELGLLTIVDGAHAPGQIPLSLRQIGADIYTGACHKWMCAPKGSAFLYARRELQPNLDPLVISWGWQADDPGVSQFVDHHEWQGTFDPAAYLAVPAAIDFQKQHGWDAIRRDCHNMAVELRDDLVAQLNLKASCLSNSWFGQMFSVELPELDTQQLQRKLREDFAIEVVCHRWQNTPLLRVSLQGYNQPADAQALLSALGKLLPAG